MNKIFVSLLVFLLAAPASADIVILETGERVAGEILKDNAVFVRIKTQGSIQLREFLKENVKEVIYEDDTLAPIDFAADPPKRPTVSFDTLKAETTVLRPPESVMTEEVFIPEESGPRPEPLLISNEDIHRMESGILPRQINDFFGQQDVTTSVVDDPGPPPEIDLSVNLLNWMLALLVMAVILFWTFKRGQPVRDRTYVPAPAAPKRKMGELISLSIERTKKILFRPFQWKKWLKLAFIALMAGGLTSGSANFSGPGDYAEEAEARMQFVTEAPVTGEATLTGSGEVDPESLQALLDPANWDSGVVTWIVIIVMFGGAIALVFMWLSSRFQFIWTNAILNDDTAIADPFHRYHEQGNSLFRVYVIVMFLSLGIFCLHAVWVYLMIRQYGLGGGVPGILSLILPQGLSFATIMIFLSVVIFLIQEFVNPMMYLQQEPFQPAWQRFVHLYREQKGAVWKFLWMSFFLRIICGILALVLVIIVGLVLVLCAGIVFGLLYLLISVLLKQQLLFTIVAVLLGIPTFVVALLVFMCAGLPFAVFFRSFSLFILHDFQAGLDLSPWGFAPVPESAPPVPPSVPPPVRL